MTQRMLIEPLIPVADAEGMHRFGGVCDADLSCPNCRLPFLSILTLNGSDPALKSVTHGQLPLLYCMRCALCWKDFAYHIDSAGRMKVVKANLGQTVWKDWYPEMSDTLAEIRVRLEPAPRRLQELQDTLNEVGDLPRAESEEFNRLVRREPSRAVDVVNQVGGRAFLFQRLVDPACPSCMKQKIFFLASVCNDPHLGIKVAPDQNERADRVFLLP